MKEIKIKTTRELQSVPVAIEFDDGSIEKYSLNEMTGFERKKAQERIFDNVDMSKTQNERKKDLEEAQKTFFKESEYVFLSLCLKKENGDAVSLDEIYQMKPKVLNVLIEACNELNGFDEDAVDEAKNV